MRLSLRLTFCLSKVKRKVDPTFEYPVFDLAREKLKRVIRQLKKPQEALEKSLYICFKCGSNKIFSIAKRFRSADEGMSIFSKCRDCHNKWRNWLCDWYLIKIWTMGIPTISITSDVLGFLRYDSSINWVYFGSLKIITSYMIQQPKSMWKFVLYI